MSKYEGWHGLVRESEHSIESLRWRDLKRAGRPNLELVVFRG